MVNPFSNLNLFNTLKQREICTVGEFAIIACTVLKRRSVYMVNLFSSLNLLYTLKQREIYAVGRICNNFLYGDNKLMNS